MTDRIDWDRAVVKVTAPVQHTANETTQSFDLTLDQLAALLAARLGGRE